MTMSMSSPLPTSGAKRMMKVLCPIEKEGEQKKTYWIRCGTAFWNRDQSINLYLPADIDKWGPRASPTDRRSRRR